MGDPISSSTPVAAVVPACNEEKRIGAVLDVLLRSRSISEVIVADDGSQDRTAEVAKNAGARVITLPENRGKGAALKAGSLATSAPILLFIDADLVGLKEEHIEALLAPVQRGEADMSLGIFVGGRRATDWALRWAPQLSGQRALVRRIIETLPDSERARYGIEVALNRHARRLGMRLVRVPLRQLAQVMKEEKIGLWRGVWARLRMYWEILRVYGR